MPFYRFTKSLNPSCYRNKVCDELDEGNGQNTSQTNVHSLTSSSTVYLKFQIILGRKKKEYKRPKLIKISIKSNLKSLH